MVASNVVSIFAFIVYIAIKFVTCGQFYETDERQKANISYTVLSTESQPSQLSCLHVCQIKHRYSSAVVVFENGLCRCLQEDQVGDEFIINGQYHISRLIPKVLCVIVKIV